MVPHGQLCLGLDEDLAECIAAWHESGHVHPPDFPRVHAGPSRGASFTTDLDKERPGWPVRDVAHCLQQAASTTIVCVNVGGVIFNTSSNTLRKAPFFDSMLRYTKEGALGATFDELGNLFVDRSGDLFGYILEYLRSGHWLLRERASDLVFIEALRDEAGFYGLHPSKDRFPMPRITEYVTVWQFRDDTSLYVDCLEQTIREDPDHPGLFRLCKYSGGLPLDQQTCTKRFKVTSHSAQSVVAYFGMRGFTLQQVIQGSMITHTTSADGQGRCGQGIQYMLSRSTSLPTQWQTVAPTPPTSAPSALA